MPFDLYLDFLDTKINEEIDHVDQIIISESNQDYLGVEKDFACFSLKDAKKYRDPKIKLVFIENKFNKLSEDKDILEVMNYNKDTHIDLTIENIEIKDEDIIFLSDIDEVLVKEDFDIMIEETIKAGTEGWGPDNSLKGQHCRLDIFNGEKSESPLWDGPISITGDLFNNLPKRLKKPGREVFLKIKLSGIRKSPFGKLIPTKGYKF